MAEEAHIKEYLSMQRRKYEERSNTAVLTPHGISPGTETVVGSYVEQEKFPYDQNILKHFNKPLSEATLLEYGCGPGRNLLRLSKKFKNVIGIDISSQNLVNAQKLFLFNDLYNGIFHLTSGDNIPIENDQADIVFEVICLQHICSYAIRKRILTDMVRVCKKGGQVACQFGFNLEIPKNTHYVGYYEDQLLGVHDTNGWADCCVTEESQLRKDFEELGLKVLDIWHTGTVKDENHFDWVWICGEKP